MNDKASVSKEQNARHIKILETILRLPENRECADCRSRAPRWASVNLGIFICMQCSGIHRSLGVHISKVRSTTLDTWLPEQIAFMKSMGNQRANIYWEAKLPQNYDRGEIAKFIRAKYQDKKWVGKMTIVTQDELACTKKTRKLSLEEDIFSKHMTQITPTRQRPISFDTNFGDTSKHDSSSSIPAVWATFD